MTAIGERTFRTNHVPIDHHRERTVQSLNAHDHTPGILIAQHHATQTRQRAALDRYILPNPQKRPGSQRPPLRHFDISPANIIIESARGRAMLVGFPVQPPPPEPRPGLAKHLTTRKIQVSVYTPIKDAPFPFDYRDHRTCIYMLAASMHQALTNYAPPHYPVFPPARQLNPLISPELEAILNRALQEEPRARYQSYAEMKRDVQRLL